MGKSFGYKCNKCGKYIWFSIGTGIAYSYYYNETKKKIMNGELGERYKEFFEMFPDAATDAEIGAYECLSCGEVFNEMNLGMYLPKDKIDDLDTFEKEWIETVVKEKRSPSSIELELGYELFEGEEHKCCKCSSAKVRKIEERSILEYIPKCYQCDASMDLVDFAQWD